jgi:hypothetical protein
MSDLFDAYGLLARAGSLSQYVGQPRAMADEALYRAYMAQNAYGRTQVMPENNQKLLLLEDV